MSMRLFGIIFCADRMRTRGDMKVGVTVRCRWTSCTFFSLACRAEALRAACCRRFSARASVARPMEKALTGRGLLLVGLSPFSTMRRPLDRSYTVLALLATVAPLFGRDLGALGGLGPLVPMGSGILCGFGGGCGIKWSVVSFTFPPALPPATSHHTQRHTHTHTNEEREGSQPGNEVGSREESPRGWTRARRYVPRHRMHVSRAEALAGRGRALGRQKARARRGREQAALSPTSSLHVAVRRVVFGSVGCHSVSLSIIFLPCLLSKPSSHHATGHQPSQRRVCEQRLYLGSRNRSSSPWHCSSAAPRSPTCVRSQRAAPSPLPPFTSLRRPAAPFTPSGLAPLRCDFRRRCCSAPSARALLAKFCQSPHSSWAHRRFAGSPLAPSLALSLSLSLSLSPPLARLHAARAPPAFPLSREK